jgi:hypothetical protein
VYIYLTVLITSEKVARKESAVPCALLKEKCVCAFGGIAIYVLRYNFTMYNQPIGIWDLLAY